MKLKPGVYYDKIDHKILLSNATNLFMVRCSKLRCRVIFLHEFQFEERLVYLGEFE